jgi:hypothetical protein
MATIKHPKPNNIVIFGSTHIVEPQAQGINNNLGYCPNLGAKHMTL